MNNLIEIRSLNLKPGRREGFHRLYIEKALPLLKRLNFDMVAYSLPLIGQFLSINRILSPSSSTFQRLLQSL